MTSQNNISTAGSSSGNILFNVPEWKLHQEHDQEIKRIMDAAGCTLRKWNGKAFWTLAKECGHTSLDFKKCSCRNGARI